MKKHLLLITLFCVLALCACEKNGNEKKENVTPTPTEEVSVTPTAEPTAEPSPEPTGPAVELPEDFPESMPLKRDAKFTQTELTDKIRTSVLSEEQYWYQETTVYAGQMTLETMANGKPATASYDEVVKLYADTYNPDAPAAVKYLLNGETVAEEYHTAYGTLTVFGGNREYVADYYERDAEGNVLYYQADHSFSYSEYDETGRLVSKAVYQLPTTTVKTGNLLSLTLQEFDDHGNESRYLTFTVENDKLQKSLDYTYVYEYAEDGNLSFSDRKESTAGKVYMHQVYRYAVEKDETGRFASAIYTDELTGKEALKLFLFYHDDGAVMLIGIMHDAVDSDGNPMETVKGLLVYPSEEDAEKLRNGIFLGDLNLSANGGIVKEGEMKRVAEGETENCFAFIEDVLWHDNTYQNGRLVHEINNTKSGCEFRYEYDRKGRVTRQYGHVGGAGKLDCRYTYDADGRLVKEVKSCAYKIGYGSDYYEYGEEEWFDTEMHITETVSYTFDANGNQTGIERTVTRDGAVVGTEKADFEEGGYPNHTEAVKTKDGKQVFKLVGERIAHNES